MDYLFLGSFALASFKAGKQFRPKAGRTLVACGEKEALGILQKGWLVRTQVGQKIPACGSERLCGMAMCVKKPFAYEPLFTF